jgi:glycosyltransferase involved in cell wall biosynthesis
MVKLKERMLVSILIPVFNAEKYLGECLDSVLAQTHRDLQVVAINDGSTDHSASILNEYAARDSRLQVVHRENRGVATTRLELLSLAKGDYVNFVDSDDTIQPDMIQCMVSACEENHLDMLVCCFNKEMTLTAHTENAEDLEIVDRDRASREFFGQYPPVGYICSNCPPTRRLCWPKLPSRNFLWRGCIYVLASAKADEENRFH